jgi:hypothetical protein
VGDFGWVLLVIGFGMLAVMVGAVIFGKKPENFGCPKCEHEAGLDERRRHCDDADQDSGWSGGACRCQHDYHWNFESVDR